MKKTIRKIAMVILFVVFVVSMVLMLRQWKDNAGAQAAYQDAVAIALQKPAEKLPEEREAESARFNGKADKLTSGWMPAQVTDDPVIAEMTEINLEALREVNPDVVGWIRIPGTKINYPVMQGEDNDFYLNHTWDKEPNSVGSVFLEYQNSPGFSDYNTIVYGHNMNDGSMFADLELYAVQAFWREHPYVYILTYAGVYRYEIFAFFQAEVESLTYGLNPKRNGTKQDFLDLALEKAHYDTGIKPAITDRILTLSTCSGANYDYRYVVQARLPMVEVTQ